MGNLAAVVVAASAYAAAASAAKSKNCRMSRVKKLCHKNKVCLLIV